LITNLSEQPVEHRWEEAGRCFFALNGPGEHALPPWSVFWRCAHLG